MAARKGGPAAGPVLEGHTDAVRAVAVTKDGRHAVSGSRDATVRVWDLVAAREGRSAAGPVLEGHTSEVNAVAMTKNGRYAVSGSRDKTVRVWDLATAQRIAVCPIAYPVATLAVGGQLVVAGGDNGSLYLFQQTLTADRPPERNTRDEDGRNKPIGEIIALNVRPDCWRLGFGRALCDHALSDARRRRWTAVTLWILKGNERAARSYEALGFVAEGTERLDKHVIGAPIYELRYRKAL
jgi:ribosomal protein S18 acetylase RimI-like enzyme